MNFANWKTCDSKTLRATPSQVAAEGALELGDSIDFLFVPKTASKIVPEMAPNSPCKSSIKSGPIISVHTCVLAILGPFSGQFLGRKIVT